jgi:hypothetical protein
LQGRELRASWEQEATVRRLPPIPRPGFLHSQSKPPFVLHFFIYSVKKYFGFLRGALRIPFKPGLIILSG